MATPLESAKKLTRYNIPVIPTKNKIPVNKWTERRNQVATEQELVTWFSNGKANGIAIPINNTEFAIDTDGTCESLFLNKVVRSFRRRYRRQSIGQPIQRHRMEIIDCLKLALKISRKE
jgi:hypothetical protein